MIQPWDIMTGYGYDTYAYTLDQVGRISQVDTTINGNPKTLASNITYLPFGSITGLTYGNGLTLAQARDNQYRISSIQAGSVLNMAFGYDANGNITSKTDTNSPGGQPPETPETYEYQAGTNELVHINDSPNVDFGYDANGNITSENTWTYVYDLSNQLIQVLDGTNQIVEYVYNGVGQRIKKVTPSETRIFHYDLQGHLITETNSSGEMIAEYVYIGDQLLAMIKPGEMAYYFHNDHLGTPYVLTDGNGTISWKALYTPFGQAAISVETIENPFRLPGQYYDTETGLHYNYFRYYDPTTGRYITPDPIGLWGGINLFPYSKLNPLKFIDPLGLFEITVYDPGGRTGPTYGGDITVTEEDGETVQVSGSSWPNPQHPSPGIATGDYTGVFSPTGHQGQYPGIRIEDGHPVPTLGPNPGQGGQEFSTGINIHCGDSTTNRGSGGCVTIDPDSCQQVWSILHPGETGTITIRR